MTTAALGGWEDPVVLLKRYAHAEELTKVAEASFGKKNTVHVTRLAQARARKAKIHTEQEVA